MPGSCKKEPGSFFAGMPDLTNAELRKWPGAMEPVMGCLRRDEQERGIHSARSQMKVSREMNSSLQLKRSLFPRSGINHFPAPRFSWGMIFGTFGMNFRMNDTYCIPLYSLGARKNKIIQQFCFSGVDPAVPACIFRAR